MPWRRLFRTGRLYKSRSLVQVLLDRRALTAEAAAAVTRKVDEYLTPQRDAVASPEGSGETLPARASAPTPEAVSVPLPPPRTSVAASSNASAETQVPRPPAASTSDPPESARETFPPPRSALAAPDMPGETVPPPTPRVSGASFTGEETLPPSGVSPSRTARKPAVSNPQPGGPANAGAVQTQPASTGGLVIGPTIPGYKLLGELGRGGMGVVYKAQDVKLNRLVALKMILSGEYAEEADVERFRLEAEAVAKLQHPNIVQVFAIDECDGRPYFSLEFVDGGPLDKKLGGDPLPPARPRPCWSSYRGRCTMRISGTSSTAI